MNGTCFLNQRLVFREVGKRIVGDIEMRCLPGEEAAQQECHCQHDNGEAILGDSEGFDDPIRQVVAVHFFGCLACAHTLAELGEQRWYDQYGDNAVEQNRE